MNDKVIFKTLQDVMNMSQGAVLSEQNRLFFTRETFDIFHHLLTTMLRLSLLESENDYLSFIEPFIDDSSVLTKTLSSLLSQQPTLTGSQEDTLLLTQHTLLDAQRSYFKLISQMKDTSFRARFSLILRLTWLQVASAERAVEGIRVKMDA